MNLRQSLLVFVLESDKICVLNYRMYLNYPAAFTYSQEKSILAVEQLTNRHKSLASAIPISILYFVR